MSMRRLQAKTEINMTPLIDVILQLIIFFMITTTFRAAPGIPSTAVRKRQSVLHRR